MSLNYVGISHFPVLHRQFSSPTSTVSLESHRTTNQDLAQDNKDVLTERLTDFVLRLSKDSSLEDSTVSAIHTGVDRIESLLKSRGKRLHKSSFSDGSQLGFPKTGEDMFWAPLTPPRNVRMLLPEPFISASQRATSGVTMNTEYAVKIARSAEELASKLSVTIAELQIRKEETDHIHDLLITRVEIATRRILALESRIGEMEADLDANQSELKFLRIQLKAVEAQCSQCVPQDIDPELSQSIMSWKLDWQDIDRRSKARRQKNHPSITSLDSPRTVDGTLSDALKSG